MTGEPAGASSAESGGAAGNLYMIHKHDATRLHYDLRLQVGDVLKSWAVPKGPSLDPHERRLAVEVEDHPLEYGAFEGVIPEGNYGAGATLIWDRGTWAPMGDLEKSLKSGTLKFRLAGEKLKGGWTLVRLKRRPGREAQQLAAHQGARRGGGAPISTFLRSGRRASSPARPSRTC